ncbi:MAG: FG-GAP repeat protein [Phycisphaerales bacterium]|nr:FG-GAP repeat protein [Phycisphaerales bacterium]
MRGDSIDADAAVVGSWADDRKGSAYLFRADAAGAWAFSAKLSAADGEQRDQFGDAVAVSGSTVLIGNWNDDDLGSASGSAYIFAPCPADLSCDGFIDFADYLQFLNFFEALDPAADFTGDGSVDLADYFAFLDRYDAGC